SFLFMAAPDCDPNASWRPAKPHDLRERHAHSSVRIVSEVLRTAARNAVIRQGARAGIWAAQGRVICQIARSLHLRLKFSAPCRAQSSTPQEPRATRLFLRAGS